MTSSTTISQGAHLDVDKKRRLTKQQVAMIEEALRALGDFGEVRLVVEKGRLRFIVTQKSYDALKWHPGAIAPLD